MNKVIERIRANYGEIEHNETGMEAVQVILFILLGAALIGFIGFVVWKLVHKTSDGIEKQSDKTLSCLENPESC